MAKKRPVWFGLLVCILVLFSLPLEAYSHGLGYEILPPVNLGSKLVALEVSSSVVPDTNVREISFVLFDTSNGVTIKDVTFFIMAIKQNETLFDVMGQRDDGTFILKLIPGESEQVSIDEEEVNFFGSVLGANKITSVEGNAFNSGGLYNFKVLITTAEGYKNFLSPPIDYEVGISFRDSTYYDVNDINFGKQQLGIISYYDIIEDNISYDSNKRGVTYSMPFDWSKENIEQTTVVHQEIVISKTFGDLMVKSFSAKINGLDISDSSITVDDFSDENRTVHLVVSQNELLELSEKLQNTSSKIEFAIIPTNNLPLSTVTENGQFKINLSWEPQDIKSGSKITFLFDILDVFLLDRPVSVSYDLSAIYDGKKLFQKNGISTDIRNEHNKIEFLVPGYVTGPIMLQFENLDNNDLAYAVLPVVVDRVSAEQTAIPAWIKNNAGWWAADQIDDSAFLQGIQYLIKEGIMIIPSTEASGSTEIQEVPIWIKNNAGWWAADQIDDSSFLQGIQYLVQKGIIVV